MIIDRLENAANYFPIHQLAPAAFHYLQNTDLANLAPGQYSIDGDNLFAIVQIYETLDPENEVMESHKKYIDIHYMVKGTELVGHALLKDHTVTKEYDEEKDFMLYSDEPTFFSKLETGTFMLFYPTDLHMPCLEINGKEFIKKVVIKMKV